MQTQSENRCAPVETDVHREYVIPNNRQAIELIRGIIMQDLSTLDVDEGVAFGISLCLSEALDNAYQHGNQGDPNRTITIRYDFGSEQICIEIEDQGRGFQPEAIPDPTLPENLTKEGGRGLFLMRAYMDEVTYCDAGNRVRLLRRRKAA